MGEPVFEVHERQSRFILERYEDIRRPTASWLVKYVLPRRGVAFIAGASKCGKTFLALDWCLRIATGQEVLDQRTLSGAVAYFAAEDDDGVRLRVDAWRQVKAQPAAAFRLVAQAPDLRSDDDIEDIRETLGLFSEEISAEGWPLRAVVFDTLSQSLNGADENSSADMSSALHNLMALSRDLDCLVIVVAHTGKDETRGIRGWSGLLGNADAVVMVERPAPTDEQANPPRRLTLDKVKNGRDGDVHEFELLPVRVGEDADGDGIYSLVPEYLGHAAKAAKPTRDTPRDKLVSRAIRLCEEAGQAEHLTNVPDVPEGAKGVPRAALKDRLLAEGYSDKDESADAVKKRINRDLQRLIGLGRIRSSATHVWRIDGK